MNPLKAPGEPWWVGAITAILLLLVLVVCGNTMRITYDQNKRECHAQGGHLARGGCEIP